MGFKSETLSAVSGSLTFDLIVARVRMHPFALDLLPFAHKVKMGHLLVVQYLASVPAFQVLEDLTQYQQAQSGTRKHCAGTKCTEIAVSCVCFHDGNEPEVQNEIKYKKTHPWYRD